MYKHVYRNNKNMVVGSGHGIKLNTRTEFIQEHIRMGGLSKSV